MQLIKTFVPDNFNIFLVGDAHIGSTHHHADGWATMVDMVNDIYHGCRDNLVVDHGDTIEAIQSDDPRFHIGTTKESEILAQIEHAKRDRIAIQKSLVAIMEGNHERKYHRFGRIVEKLLCAPLEVPYGSYSCKIAYVFDDGTHIKHFAGHGWGSIGSIADDEIRRQTNMRLSLKRKLKHKAGDAILMSMGHTHKLLYQPPTRTLYLTDDGNKIFSNYTTFRNTSGWIHPDHRHYVNTGSFFRLYGDMGESGYAEVAGYDPVELGFAVAMVRDRELVDVKLETLS